jgi:hypothetical protein
LFILALIPLAEFEESSSRLAELQGILVEIQSQSPGEKTDGIHPAAMAEGA